MEQKPSVRDMISSELGLGAGTHIIIAVTGLSQLLCACVCIKRAHVCAAVHISL